MIHIGLMFECCPGAVALGRLLTPVCLCQSPSSIRAVMSAAGKVTAGLAEGSLIAVYLRVYNSITCGADYQETCIRPSPTLNLHGTTFILQKR